MKKFFALLLIASMLIINCNAAVVEVNIGGIKVNSVRDGENRTILLEEVPFVNESGRTMVPVRAISESFGAGVSWDGEKQEVKIVNGDKTILLYIDSNKALLNGEEIILDSAPVIKGGRTFVPLRFIGESFGYNINYVATTKQIIIDDTDIVLKADNAKLTFAEIEALYNIYYQVDYKAAMAKGMSEEEFSAYALYRALQVGLAMVMIMDATPGAALTEEDIEFIRENIKSDSAYFTLPLEGISALMHEKLYYSNGGPALSFIAKSDAVKEIYEKNYVRAKHILVDDEDSAKEVLGKISAGEDFDALIAEYGKDPGMERNKDGYVFTYDEMIKPFEEASFALSVGEISEPVKGTHGYHIIKREALPEMPESIANAIAEGILAERLKNAKEPELLILTEELLEMLG